MDLTIKVGYERVSILKGYQLGGWRGTGSYGRLTKSTL
jgi:hypothetical protein